jgi:hypothetical protein
MRPNPLSSTESAPTDAASAGTQLRIAARGKGDVHDVSPAAIQAEVARLVQALADRNETLLQQVRADATRDISELQAIVEQRDAQLKSARESLESATRQAETERGGRRTAERERDEARAAVAHLTCDLEEVRTERAKLAAALATIREAVLQASSPDNHQGESTAVSTPEVALFETTAEEEVTPISSVDPELADHVKRLLDQAKDMYLADMKSGTPPVEVVDRLTSILRYSRDLVLHRSADNPAAGMEAFNEEVNRLLDAEGASSFGRHLSIAAFAARSDESAAG